MELRLHEIGMPTGGLFREGRWLGVSGFPPAAKAITPKIHQPGRAYTDGQPRFEDATGRFATAKFTVSEFGAIGRALVPFRTREIGGVNLLDRVKAFVSEVDPEHEHEIPAGRVPDAFFEDAYLLPLEYDPEVRVIDVEHDSTRETLERILRPQLELIGASIEPGISQHRDRRVTRLVMTTIYDLCAANERRPIAGIRYAALDHEWDAYVFWSPPRRVDLSAGLPRPLFPDDPLVIEVARSLGLRLPGEERA
jgi:hypothetical protein